MDGRLSDSTLTASALHVPGLRRVALVRERELTPSSAIMSSSSIAPGPIEALILETAVNGGRHPVTPPPCNRDSPDRRQHALPLSI
jgi:hypothetical protein